MSDSFDVLVFGSSIVDFVCYVPRLPEVGETLLGTRFCVGYGGKGANQCVAAAKLGAKTAMVTKLGDDLWGRNYLENLREQGVNTDMVEEVKNETTGIAQITVDEKGNNHIVIVTGANQLLSSVDVKLSSQLFENSKVLICQLETPLDGTISALEVFKGVSILNAAPALENLSPDLIRLPTIFCVNEVEAALITGIKVTTISHAKDAITRLVELGSKTVIITLGDQGATYSTPEDRRPVHVKVRKVDNVVDTTGAGDAFIGSLAYYICRNPDVPFHQQIGAACEIAAISVQSTGTQKSFPSYKDVHIDFTAQQFEWRYI